MAAATWTHRQAVPGGAAVLAVDCPSALVCVGITAGGRSLLLPAPNPPTGSTHLAPLLIETIARAELPTELTCTAPTACLTYDGLGRVLTYDGRRWSRPVMVDPERTNGSIAGISCATASFCAVVDSTGNAAFFDGTRWSKPLDVAGSSGLSAVSCPAPGLCFALDSESDDVYRFANGYWEVASELNLSTPQGGSEPNSLNALSCGSATFCVALDDFGDAFTYNGTWSTGPHTFDSIELGINAISCTAARRCAVVDDSGDAVIDDDGSWSAPEHLGRRDATLEGVSCAPGGRCLAVDGAGGYFVARIGS